MLNSMLIQSCPLGDCAGGFGPADWGGASSASFIISFMGMFMVYSFMFIWFLLADTKHNREK